MAELSGGLVAGPPPAGPHVSLRGVSRRLLEGWRWEVAVAVVAVISAAVAVVVTLRADFLAHPGLLAVQKADLILGPVGVGLYWRRRRPRSAFGPLLIAVGLIGVPYILQSSANPYLFGVGVAWEEAIYLSTAALILAFPTGRLNRLPERLILGMAALTEVLPFLVLQLISPQLGPDGSISGCRELCPANGLAISSHPSLATALLDVGRVGNVTVALATIGLISWRFASGTPPRRRALAIGAPVALVFLIMQATYQALKLLDPDALALHDVIQWTFAVARSALWYGFLLALVAAQLSAGRMLHRLVGDSLGRPSFRQLEGMLRGPLGDPGLRLGFWRPRAREWADADGAPLAAPAAGQTFTEVERDGSPAAGIVHDQQLAEDPELLQAAGAVALLALENAELDAAWKGSLRELADSRARIVTAGERERRKLERDLHDGAQQRLLGALLRVSAAGEHAAENPDVRRELDMAGRELETAIDELRELAHGIYPTLLAEHGLAAAIRGVAARSASTISVSGMSQRRFAPEIEAALYYCCLEAVQNASKHAGPDAQISIRLRSTPSEVSLEVRDNGPGFDVTAVRDGAGLQNMRDRLGAVGGHVEIAASAGLGMVVSAQAPIRSPARTAGQADRVRGLPTSRESGMTAPQAVIQDPPNSTDEGEAHPAF